MRYEFVGRKTAVRGKTLWEIVGNLKNFGVGRLVKKCSVQNHPELSFMKILQVRPLPPKKDEFKLRPVMVQVEEIFRGRRKPPEVIVGPTVTPKYELIPKIEEEEYLKRAEELKRPVKYISKYSTCPPLYRKLWESESSKNESLTKLETKVHAYSEYDVILKDETYPPHTCSLYKTNQTVEEMYLEIVRLKKIIKSNEHKEQ